MKIWKWMGKLCSVTPWTRRWSLRLYQGWKRVYYRQGFQKKETTEPHTVVFEAYMGQRYACSPKALYQAMLRDPRYKSWKKIWAFRDPEAYRFLEQADVNTRVVAYGKRAYYRAHARAGYWITNSRLPKELACRPDQEYIQCWHGTPLKKLGFDLEQYAEQEGTLEEVRENYLAEARRMTRMPSPSPFFSEKMISAFHLDAFGKESILLERGYPRNDRLFTYEASDIVRIREKLGIAPGKKVILYAPTWRENQHVPGEGYRYRLQADFAEWQRRLGADYQLLFRAHYFISNSFDFSPYGDFVRDVSDLDDVNDLYLIADLLITDYSSVFFDYANLRRPILFYMYDYEAYKEEMRDFYLDIRLLPGPVVRTQEALLDQLERLEEMTADYQERYETFNRLFNPHPGPCCEVYLKAWLGQTP